MIFELKVRATTSEIINFIAYKLMNKYYLTNPI